MRSARCRPSGAGPPAPSLPTCARTTSCSTATASTRCSSAAWTPKRIIWFDIGQKNNESESEALRKLGFVIVQTESIAETVQRLGSENFDVIITHYGFNPDKEKSNAYRLRNAILQAGLPPLPMIIYTVGVTDEYACAVQKDGFYDEIDMPAQLIEVAVRSAGHEAARPRCQP
jgi:DNA-binding NtrC family response regulator